jgi:hypothetical protein
MRVFQRPRALISAALFCCSLFAGPAAYAQTQVQPGQVIISEFRTRGPAGSADEFVELYNNTDVPVVVQSTDGSAGWSVTQAEADPVEGFVIFGDPVVIPNGTIIPARGHLLLTCSSAVGGPYSLNAYAAGDITYAQELMPEGTGIALFSTSEFDNYSSGTRLDAVGYQAAPGLSEGTPLPQSYVVTANTEHSIVRRASGNLASQDTNNNAADFILVAANAAQFPGSRLGAPGPENSASPVVNNTTIALTLFDPSASASSPPNRERRPNVVPNGNLGTLIIRRRVTNNTGRPVTRLRFRIAEMTTIGTENTCGRALCADIRALTSQDGEAGSPSMGVVPIRGLRLEEPPAQPLGGGFNSSLSADFITLSSPLLPGESVNVHFVLGVMRSGTFRFFVNIEAHADPAIADEVVGPLR